MNTKILKTLLIYIALTQPALFAQTYVETFDVTDIMEKPYTPQQYRPYSDEEIEREAEMVASANGHTNQKDAVITSTSYVNWTKNSFTSDVSLDVEKAGIPMPSGKATSVRKIEVNLPILVKDPLLSLYVDDSKTLNDLVLDGTVTLENITRIVDNARRTPSVFAEGGSNLLTKHSIDLRNISSSLVKHEKPYTQSQPIDSISSRKYTGIVLDARGTLDVQGEFTKSRVYPCLFPKVWNEEMDLVYEKNMVNVQTAKKDGIEYNSRSDLIEDYNGRAGKDPLWLSEKKVSGIHP